MPSALGRASLPAAAWARGGWNLFRFLWAGILPKRITYRAASGNAEVPPAWGPIGAILCAIGEVILAGSECAFWSAAG